MDKKQKVLNFALKRFMESGYSAVSMDDISHGCGISKATLYSLFPSKEELVLSSIETIAAEITDSVTVVMDDPSLSTAEKFSRFFIPVAEKLSRVNVRALEDIRRNVPEAYEKIEQVRRKLIFSNISRLIEEGKKCGYILEDVDPKLVSHILIGIASHIVDPDVLREFGQSPDRILHSVISIIIRGCVNEKVPKTINIIE